MNTQAFEAIWLVLHQPARNPINGIIAPNTIPRNNFSYLHIINPAIQVMIPVEPDVVIVVSGEYHLLSIFFKTYQM